VLGVPQGRLTKASHQMGLLTQGLREFNDRITGGIMKFNVGAI